jgi:hypothetical protein
MQPNLPWRSGLVVLSPPATEETGAMGREIESRQGIGWKFLEKKNKMQPDLFFGDDANP